MFQQSGQMFRVNFVLGATEGHNIQGRFSHYTFFFYQELEKTENLQTEVLQLRFSEFEKRKSQAIFSQIPHKFKKVDSK
jgi:hypothetical protein